MRKKLIDLTKADIKKYMMIVESAGKVPASTREDFTLEDIENPYFQGDEDTEESEGNRYYVTVGVKIGYDGNTESYFPEVIWDQETGTEIEFDKLDKISKKSIQDKCDEIGPKIHVQRKGVNESTQIVVKALMQKFKISESKAKSIVAKVSESLKHPIKESYQFSKRQNPQSMKDGEICVIKDDLNGYVKDLTYMGGDDWEPSFVRDITKAKKYIVGSEKLDDVFNNPEFNNFPDGFAFKIEPAPKKAQTQ